MLGVLYLEDSKYNKISIRPQGTCLFNCTINSFDIVMRVDPFGLDVNRRKLEIKNKSTCHVIFHVCGGGGRRHASYHNEFCHIARYRRHIQSFTCWCWSGSMFLSYEGPKLRVSRWKDVTLTTLPYTTAMACVNMWALSARHRETKDEIMNERKKKSR